MERLNRVRCLQEHIGSCMGCPMQDLAMQRLMAVGEDQKSILIKKVSKELCPEGNKMQMPRTKKQSLW